MRQTRFFKPMKMKFTNLVLAIIATLSILSCKKIDQNTDGAQSGNATIRLEVDMSAELTRATQQQESALKSLTAYVFVVDGKPSAGKLVPSTTKAVINGTAASVSIIIDNDFNPIDDARVDVYLVANASVKLPNDNTAKAAFMNATINGFDNTASEGDFPGLAAMKYVGVFSVRPADKPSANTVTLNRVQARVFVSNTEVAGEAPNCLGGYAISFSNLADRAVLTHPYRSNFNGVLFNAQYEYTVKGNNGDEDFYNQEPVGYLYPVPTDRMVTVTVKNPGKTATKTATFSPQSGKNYRIKITPGNTDSELGVSVELWKGEETRDRYMVVVVAGQSNAVGYDESAIFPDGLHQIDPNAFQLAYRDSYVGNMQIVPLKHCADDLQDMSTKVNKNGVKGTKGIHMPLAKELLKLIPKGYKVLVIPVAFGGTAFTSGSLGNYDAAGMKPDLDVARKWAKSSPYAKTMIDRTKYALNLNPENKFLGVVWCQGEYDRNQARNHYPAFTEMADEFFAAINLSHANRCPKGTADKDLWYNYSSTWFWHVWGDPKNYYNDFNSSDVFGSYKAWNPNTFIHVPLDTDTNTRETGTGQASSNYPTHFGNDAYAKVIAPMVARCMDENGGLFNGKPKISDQRFVEKDIKAAAASLAGKFTDADIQEQLMFFMPFLNSGTQNTAPAGGYVVETTNVSLIPSTGLIDINGAARSRKVLNVTPTGGSVRLKRPNNLTGAWSVAFLVKRTSNFSANTQPILHGTGNNSPFFGYKTYTAGNNNDEIVAGNYIEFVMERLAEPATSLTEARRRGYATAAQFIDADNVRSMDQWIHYVITFDGVNKTYIYVNGQLLPSTQFSGLNASDFMDLYIGVSSKYPNTLGAMLADVGLWNKQLSEATIKKLYLYSYYGYTK